MKGDTQLNKWYTHMDRSNVCEIREYMHQIIKGFRVKLSGK